MEKFYNEISQSIDIEKCIKCVCGNKSDLYEDEEVKKSHAEKFAKKIKATHNLVSALNSNGIEQMFLELSRKLYEEKYNTNDNNQTYRLEASNFVGDVTIDHKNKDRHKRCGCQK